MEGKMYIHPHISTVTYLSNIGAPTIALNYRVNALTGEYIVPSEDEAVQGYVSWPHKGKHLSFDGRFLHAAPSEFLERGLFEKQTEIPFDQRSETNDENSKSKIQMDEKNKTIERRYRRVTFLVNIWLNYKPFNVNIFPETMIDKLSKPDSSRVSHILFKNDDQSNPHENQLCNVKDHVCDDSPSTAKEEKYSSFQWSMGSDSDENESISMIVPINLLQNELGGNIQLSWLRRRGSDDGIKLSKLQKEDLTSQKTKKQCVCQLSD